ncbi:MAG: tetratricopeptide repeat protein [Bacteroidota bacterium]|nr:tetratricopeptide repeat protein [Bacteroidota bacterium]
MSILFSGIAQDHELMDSLRKVIPTRKDDDSMKVLQMNSLAFEYSYIDLDSGMRIAYKALELAEATDFKRGKAGIYNTIGTIYHDQANFQKAVECFTTARKFSEQGTYKSMKHMSAVIYANLANTYESMGDYDNAKHYMFESLRMFRELKDSKRFTSCYLNIGILYFESGNTDSAMYYYNEAIKFPSEKAGINASVHTSIAKCYLSENKLEEAEKEMLIALDIIKDLNSEYYEASYTNSLGEIYIRQGKYDEAEKLLLKSLNYSKHAKLLSIETSANYNLYELYMARKQFQKALEYHVQYTFLNDSINNKERNNAARELEKKYQTEKKQTEIEKLNAEKNASESESKRKSQLLVFAFIGVVLVLCALGFAIFAFINKRKANKQLQTLNKEVLLQKDELQDKNKSITDSIHYAQRIQNVLLTSHSYIKENLDQFFILNKPKDIVSGDFYWAIRHKNHFYFMVADCTGHGVPGAFMSLLGISFLNEIVLERDRTEPNEILDDLRAEIKKAFTDKDTNNEMNDGMDCALCKFDLTNNTLHYATANNSIVVVRNGEVMHLTGDKMPVGKSPRDTVSFTLNTLQLEKGDTLYMFTDGYPDQFGGTDGKKFKVKNVKQLLHQITAHPIEEQHKYLDDYFESWRGNLEQIDDVLMVGIRI